MMTRMTRAIGERHRSGSIATRNFTVTVKEREAGQPCFLVFEGFDVGGEMIFLDMPAGTSLSEARALAQRLNAEVATIGTIPLAL